jgi:ketosteroid isomerase-like protein
MSQANVEIAKVTNAALNRGDVDATLESFAPDAEVEDLANGPDQASVVKGTAAIRQAWGLWIAAFDDLRADIEEYIDVGASVICATHWMGYGKASGISVDVHQFDVYDFRDGKIVRASLGHKSKDEALRFAGHPD